VLSTLEAIKSELANKRGTPVRWATANKDEITTAIYQWTRAKMEQLKSSEAVPPETEAKIQEYEAQKLELMRMRIPMPMLPIRQLRMPPGFERSEAPATNLEYEAMAKRVAEAKAPIAAIVDRRERQAAQYREQYSVDRLVAEYVRDRYDLVVDTREKVLYRTADEVPDITEGVLTFFKEKAKP
jgi:hypothetical protein